MTNPTINVDLARSIEVEIGNKTINIYQVSGGTANHVPADTHFSLSGPGGTTYLKYNSTSGLVELWVKGIKEKKWGAIGSDPFA